MDRYSDETIVIAEGRIIDNWQRLECKWTRIMDGVASSYQFVLRVFGATDLKELLLSHGFDNVDLYGSLEDTPYDHTARRLVAVARM